MTNAAWPAVGGEELVWTPAAEATWGVNTTRGGRATTYRAALVPLIAGRVPQLSEDAQRDAEGAAHELTRFDAELGERVASFAPVLLRSEAASSSQIENLTASARAIFSAELGVRRSRNAEEIAANTKAMRAALDLANELSAEAILKMHRVLMEEQPRHTPGEWRDEPVWIGTRSDSPRGAEYVAPRHERIPALVQDLVEFMGETTAAPLVAVAVAHAQFETIHPFSDGNGRTGRALAQAMLRHWGVTRNVAVPVSAGLLADVSGYHSALDAYRAGDVEPIVRQFSAASRRAVANARQLVADIDRIRDEWGSMLTVRKNSNAWKLLDVLARRPVLNSATAAAELGVKQPNVYPPLRRLTEAGIVRSKNEHQLGPFWCSDEVLAAIDAFAVRAGRRSGR
ncbi:Fic family protein [Kocuria varians]|uniref:Fic family protein n=1 Tax=Kocuria varians TaxID=1272 RepID=UPI000839633E|nr:Fic family protein [Kocuria varians]